MILYSKCRQLQSLALLSHGGPGDQAWDLSNGHESGLPSFFSVFLLRAWNFQRSFASLPKSVVSSAPDTTYFFIMPVTLVHLAGCTAYLQSLLLILSFSNILCLLHAAALKICPFVGQTAHIFMCHHNVMMWSYPYTILSYLYSDSRLASINYILTGALLTYKCIRPVFQLPAPCLQL